MPVVLEVDARTRSAERDVTRLSGILETGLGTALGFLTAQAIPRMAQAFDDAVMRMGELGPVTQAFDNLTVTIGGTADTMRDKLSAATQGLVGDFDLMKAANNAITLGVAQSEDQFSDLAGAAVKLGRAVGIDAGQAIESLTAGIGRQSVQMLDNLGVIVKAEEAYEVYAQKVGKSTSELTDQEKRLAFVELATMKVKDAAEALGDAQLNLGDRIQQARTALQNFGDAALNVIANNKTLNRSLSDLMVGFNEAEGSGGLLLDTLDAMVTVVGFLLRPLADLSVKYAEASKLFEQWDGTFTGWVGMMTGAVTVTDDVAESTDGLNQSVRGSIPSVTEYVVQIEKLGGGVVHKAPLAIDAIRESVDSLHVSVEKAIQDLPLLASSLDDVIAAAGPPGADHPLAAVDDAVTQLIAKLPVVGSSTQDFGTALGQLEHDADAAAAAIGGPGDSGGKSLFGAIGAFIDSLGQWGDMLTGAFGALFSDGISGALDVVTGSLTTMLSGAFNAVIPGLGVIAAPLIGAIGDLFGGLFEKANAADHVAQQWGVSLSAALADAIDEMAKKTGGNLDAAFRLMMVDAIKEASITSKRELDKWVKLVHEVLSSVDEGFIDGAEAVDVMIDSMLELVPALKAAGGSAMDFQHIISDLITRGLIDVENAAELLGPLLEDMFEQGVEGTQELIDWLRTLGIEIEGVGEQAEHMMASWRGTWSANMQEQRREYRQLAREMGLEDEERTAWIKEQVIAERKRMRQEARQEERLKRREERRKVREEAREERKILRDIFKEPITQEVVIKVNSRSLHDAQSAIARELALSHKVG